MKGQFAFFFFGSLQAKTITMNKIFFKIESILQA